MNTTGTDSNVAGRGATLWLAVAMAALTVAVFFPVLGHTFLESWDDLPAILQNRDYNPPRLGSLGHYWVPPPKDTFYVPVTYTLWGVLAMIGRLPAGSAVPFNPAVFYAANVAAHALSAAFVFLILSRLVRSCWAAWMGAAVFALHPIQVEGVAIASSVYSPLSGALGFLAIWQYLIYSDRKSPARAGEPGNARSAGLHYASATVSFILALLTKPTVVTVPVVIAVIEIGLRHRPLKSLLAPLGAWTVLGLVVVQLNRMGSPGATVLTPEWPERVLVPLDAIAFYLRKLVVPVGLTLDYGRSPRWLMAHPEGWLWCIVPIALGVAAWLLRRRVPWLLTSAGVLVAGVLPSIGIVPFDFQHFSTVADRYFYIGMLGPALAVAWLLAHHRAIVLRSLALGMLGVLAGLSVRQLSYWKDDWQLMSYTLRANPNSLAATNGFQYLLTSWEHTQPPDGPFPAARTCTLDLGQLVEVGDIFRSRKYWELAIAAYQRALARGKPSAALYDRLGRTLDSAKEPERAQRAYAEALRLHAHNVEARQAMQGVPEVIHAGKAKAETRP